MSGERILVADDRRENLLFLADSVLRAQGYEVITAMDGKQALDKALAEKPDLIITDLKMPRLSGLELMTALQKAGADIPVILTTFYGSEQTAIEAFRLGAKDYVIKPYDIAQMLESVERALIEQRLRRETRDLKEGIEIRRHLEERVRQLHSLCGIGKALTALHDSDEAMRVAVEAAIYLTDADCGQLFLANPETGQIELRAIRGPSESWATSMQQVGADQITVRVAQTGQALIGERGSGTQAKVSRLVVPLRSDEKIIGVLGVDGKPAHVFNENDRYQLGILANFAAVALANAQLIGSLRAQLSVQPGQTLEEAGSRLPTASVSGLADSIAEAQRLSSELQDLAVAAQLLAARLEGQGGTD